MPEPLSKIERRILNYLVDYLKEHTYQPSIREIGKRFSIKSTKTVSEHLQALADKGHIERDASRSRGVRIQGLNLFPDVATVPCYGKIAAGAPALVKEAITGSLELDRKLVPSADAFVLKVSGDSMTAMGIVDGDMVVVEPVEQREIENGEIVAARLGGEATVKRYFARDGKVVLEPANPSYAPILVHEYDDFTVLGRVSGLFRTFSSKHTATVNA